MIKAYDKILSDYVDAESAAKSGGFEPYRYKCACCWEKVHLCAADSQNQVTHFRHHNGNNNIECENYLGNRNAVISNALFHQNIHDNIEFYFSNTTKMFSIGVKFSAEEISSCEQSEARFQVTDEFSSKPVISIPIRSSRFSPNTSELIPINQFSWKYYVSYSNQSNPQKYEMFRKDRHGNLYPSFFKIQANGDENTFQAKLVRSETLYTNTPYLIVFTHYHCSLSFQDDVTLGEIIRFQTMNRDFSGVVITFTKKNQKIEQQLDIWKYRLETRETLTLLWPPSPQIDESMFISAKYAYIYTSFEMQAHGNINVNSEDIHRLDDAISKITINGQIKIYNRKNAELVLDKQESFTDEYDVLPVVQKKAKHYVAQDNGTYLFNRDGLNLMNKGMSAFLTPDSQVRHYSFGYLDCVITPANKAIALVGDCLLYEILLHYKRTESFNWDDYKSLNISSTALKYIESCEKIGRINSVAKHFIEEGRI